MLPRRGAIRHATCALRASGSHVRRAGGACVRTRRGLGTRMPSPHPTSRPATAGPSAKQLRLLRRLANASAQTFTYPRTKAQASAEITRLSGQIAEHSVEQLIERRIEAD